MSDREHLFSYHYKGKEFAFGIKAASRAEAEARLKAFGWARYIGTEDDVFTPMSAWDFFKFRIFAVLAWVFSWRVRR